MITEHIPLPDPQVYRKIVIVDQWNEALRKLSGQKGPWIIKAGQALNQVHRPRTSGSMPRLRLAEVETREEAFAYRDELQKRLSVARKLLGLEV